MSSAAAFDPRVARRALLFRLRLLQLRLWLERLVCSTTRGLSIGLAIALGGAVALVAQAGLVERGYLALGVLGGLGLGLLWGLIRPPSLLHTARVADARLGLEARTGTAVELLLRPSDVALAVGEPGAISLGGRAPATVAALTPMPGRVIVRLHLAGVPQPLLAEVSPRAVHALDLAPGAAVTALWKVQAAQVREG